ncbi:MAG: squalene synthase HpnC [Acetobacteraceae bacterium]|nr:squalene synthase HpnC [Acetobacteraceae bacterium]
MSENVEDWSGKDRADENFPVGSVLIAARLRPHIHAFYAFARHADDIADSPDLAPDDKIARLDVMAAVLTGTRDTGSPSATGLRASLATTGVTPRHATDLLIAFRRDATKTRYANWGELLDYCRYSAMPVGRYVLDLHGEAADTHPPSDALCAVLQVLNHLQDGSKDLRALDRCYLPDDLLARFGGAVDDLRGACETVSLRQTFNVLLDECDALNQTAIDLPRRTSSRRLRLETAVIHGLSCRLAARLRRQDPVAGRVKLTRPDIVGALLGALRFLP